MPLSDNRRIAKNTLMLYFRQILIMLVSLYTVRVVLETLGAEDYGIYNVVAGVVTMFGFLSGAMAMASQRYFSFEMGKTDSSPEDKKTALIKLFGVTLTIYVLLSLIIVFLAETMGLWFVYNKLIVPPDRLSAAKWIYQFAILSFVITLLTTPYMAAIIAHEDMNVYAWMSIIEAVLKLVVVFVLKALAYDKLILYGALLFVVCVINTALYRAYCKKKYEECVFRLSWDSKMFREITSYVGWNLFGSGVGIVKNQGINIILNQYFGPIINASRVIAAQVNAAVSSFAQNFSTAVRPQIIKQYAAGEKEQMLVLMFRSCKTTFFLLYLFAMPLVLEMPYIMKLWLKNPPEFAILFTRLALVEAIIDSVSFPIMTAAQATGKIKLYQGVVGGILLCNLPVSFLALSLGFSPVSVMIIAICITFTAFVARLCIIKLLIDFSLRLFFTTVLFPVLSVSVLSVIFPLLIYVNFSESFLRFIATVGIAVLVAAVSIFFLGLSSSERTIATQVIKQRILKKR